MRARLAAAWVLAVALAVPAPGHATHGGLNLAWQFSAVPVGDGHVLRMWCVAHGGPGSDINLDVPHLTVSVAVRCSIGTTVGTGAAPGAVAATALVTPAQSPVEVCRFAAAAFYDPEAEVGYWRTVPETCITFEL